MIGRRKFLGALAAGGSGLILSGCDAVGQSGWFDSLAEGADALHHRSQGLLTDRAALAREYSEADMSPYFRPNGNRGVTDADYEAMLANGFRDWRLQVGGLVERPLSLSLDTLNGLARRSQITRHDCVEGWSAIGQWQGPQLGPILKAARLKREARYIVFHCADSFGDAPYYESIDLIDAFHPQTILATRMNGGPLPVEHGAPVRMRIERQLGYKHAKFVMRIEAVASLNGLYGGKGGYWEDRGYQWYAGI